MKFKYEKTIVDVVTFDVNHHGLYYFTKDLSVSGFPDLNLAAENFDGSSSSPSNFFLSGDFLCLSEESGHTIIFDLVNEKKRIYTCTKDGENNFGVRNQYISNRRELLRFNIKEGMFVSGSIWNVDTNTQRPVSHIFTYWYEDGNYVFRGHKGFRGITRLSPTDAEIWAHRTEGEYKSVTGSIRANSICDVLGTYNDYLWLTDDTGCIYSLGLETGDVFHSLTGVGSTFNYMIEPEKNRLVALQHNRICIVDISDKELNHRSTDITGLFDVYTFNLDYLGMFSKLPIVDSHIIFPDAQNAAIGVFDIDNAQVTWKHKLYNDEQLGTVKQMKYYDNALYVRCSDDTLHVFNRC